MCMYHTPYTMHMHMSMYTMHIPCTCTVGDQHMQIPCTHAMHIPCVYHAYAMPIPDGATARVGEDAPTMHIPCIYHAYTVHI